MYKLVQEDSVIFDIGARIGWYTVNFAKRYPGAFIYAFEPVHHTYSFLMKNIQLNKLINVRPENLALVNQNLRAPLSQLINESNNSIHERISHKKSHREVQCNGKKLDDYCEKNLISRLDLIMSDMLGGDIEMLQGGSATIKKLKPIIVIKIPAILYEKNGERILNKSLNFLKNLGYKCFSFLGSEEIGINLNFRDNLFFFGFHPDEHSQFILELLDREINISRDGHGMS